MSAVAKWQTFVTESWEHPDDEPYRSKDKHRVPSGWVAGPWEPVTLVKASFFFVLWRRLLQKTYSGHDQ